MSKNKSDEEELTGKEEQLKGKMKKVEKILKWC